METLIQISAFFQYKYYITIHWWMVVLTHHNRGVLQTQQEPLLGTSLVCLLSDCRLFVPTCSSTASTPSGSVSATMRGVGQVIGVGCDTLRGRHIVTSNFYQSSTFYDCSYISKSDSLLPSNFKNAQGIFCIVALIHTSIMHPTSNYLHYVHRQYSLGPGLVFRAS